MPEFWVSSGFRLLGRDDDGHLLVTDDFLRAYLKRPELALAGESCAAERALHAALVDSPQREVGPEELAGIADPDMRDNYGVWLRFRSRLLAADTVERAYLSIFQDRVVDLPPVFVDHLAQVIVRNMLDGTDDGLLARAGELFFREQSVGLQDGAVLLADADTVDMHEATGGMGSVGRLLRESNTPVKQVELKVMDPESSVLYWMRDERFDTVLQINAPHGRDAFARMIERWVEHFFRTPVTVTPVPEIEGANWIWHVGLDAEATRLLNDIYGGAEPDEASLHRILGLFQLSFHDSTDMRPEMEGRPVYLGLAMTPDHSVRLKPQNLLTNLPLARRV